ncbi:MAG: DUF4139 domain-containing protein, partial [Actinomycetota bacterium]
MTKLLAATLALLAVSPALAADVSAPERAGLALTVYQDDVAMVRDRRVVTLEKGPATLVIDGVARSARPGTATLAGSGLAVHERGFDLDGISAQRL